MTPGKLRPAAFWVRRGILECRAGSRPGRVKNFTRCSCQSFQLEEKLQGKLHQARSFCLRNLSELRAVRTISVGVEKLSVIEDVEEFAAEIDALGCRQVEGLQYREVGVTDARAAANCAFGAGNRTQDLWEGSGVLGEGVGVEVLVGDYLAWSSTTGGIGRSSFVGAASVVRIVGVEGPQLQRLTRQFEVEAVHQLIIRGRSNADGEPGLKGSDA